MLQTSVTEHLLQVARKQQLTASNAMLQEFGLLFVLWTTWCSCCSIESHLILICSPSVRCLLRRLLWLSRLFCKQERGKCQHRLQMNRRVPRICQFELRMWPNVAKVSAFTVAGTSRTTFGRCNITTCSNLASACVSRGPSATCVRAWHPRLSRP